MENIKYDKINLENIKTNEEKKNSLSFKKLARLIAFSSLFLFSNFSARSQNETQTNICPRGSKPYFFSINSPSECKGERSGKICFECRNINGKVTNISFENQREKVEIVLKSTKTKMGDNFTKKEIENAKKKIKKWNKKDLEKLIIRLNGNLTEEEKNIFRGALEHWPVLKHHSIRLKIDPRITFIVAVAESRFINIVGKSGEKSPMQIMPDTAVLMYNLYGRHDPYFIELKKMGIDWRKDNDALMILALYYLRDGLKSVNVLGKPIEKISAEEILLIYHFYNRGHNNFITDNWWQGENLATCTKKYLHLYPIVDDFVKRFASTSYSKEKVIENKIPKKQMSNATVTKKLSQNDVKKTTEKKKLDKNLKHSEQNKNVLMQSKKTDIKTEEIMKKNEEKNKEANNTVEKNHEKYIPETNTNQQLGQYPQNLDKLKIELEEIRKELEKLKKYYEKKNENVQ